MKDDKLNRSEIAYLSSLTHQDCRQSGAGSSHKLAVNGVATSMFDVTRVLQSIAVLGSEIARAA